MISVRDVSRTMLSRKNLVCAIRCGGSLSLALCLILPAVLFLFCGVLRAGRRVRNDADLASAARNAADMALACYDRDLYKTYGLFGVKEADASHAVSSVLHPEAPDRLRLEFAGELLRGRETGDGIARHMTLRAAASIITDALDKLGAMQKYREEIELASLSEFFPSALKPGYEAVDPDLGYFQEDPDWKDEYERLMDSEIRRAYQQGLTYLAPIVVPKEYDAGHVTLQMNPFDNTGMETFGKTVDKMLFVAPESVFDRLILSEYALAYFCNDVPFVLREGIRHDDHTPDGRLIAQFPDTRRYEAEEIATGLDGRTAKTTILAFIGAVRFALHFIRIITDDTIRSRYKALSVGAAAAISAVSLGEVNIPPEAIEWILMASAALCRGAADAVALNKGHEVDLWPAKVSCRVKLRYRDFLRLLIIAQSPEKITQRIACAIEKVLPGPYFTSVTCLIAGDGTLFRAHAGYLSRLPSGEVKP